MLTLQINYDERHDILYARVPNYSPSYGDESDDNVVTYYSIDTDEKTGMAIMGFKNKAQNGIINCCDLPFPLDFNNTEIKRILAS
jgi:hypothetical protein